MKRQIECKDLSLGYGSKIVLSGLNFSVSEGDFLCIAGENGSGKSTLMKTLLGLQKALGGEIKFDGLKPSDIGYLPQQTPAQRDFPASVREIVLSGFTAKMGLRPFYSATEKKSAENNMKKLGIESLSSKCYRELSGGQQQRVLLARALCSAEKILLLDEPVTGLDPQAQAEMYEIIKNLNRSGVTIIMISHDVNSIVKYSTHVLSLGKNTFFFGSVNDYINKNIDIKNININKNFRGGDTLYE